MCPQVPKKLPGGLQATLGKTSSLLKRGGRGGAAANGQHAAPLG